MRRYDYTPRAQENLADLGAFDDLDTIIDAVGELAAGKKSGDPIPFQSPLLSPDELLYQYKVGRYKLNYTITKTQLSVRSVTV